MNGSAQTADVGTTPSRPLVYQQENTGLRFALKQFKAPDELPVVKGLPDALEGVNDFNDWERRRNEIGSLIQHYGIGTKPAVDPSQVNARMEGDTMLVVDVTVNGQTLTLQALIRYPQPSSNVSPLGPTGRLPEQEPSSNVSQPSSNVSQPSTLNSQLYALMIGTDRIALPRQLFDGRPIATMTFRSAQVNDYKQWGKHHDRGEHAFPSGRRPVILPTAIRLVWPPDRCRNIITTVLWPNVWRSVRSWVLLPRAR